jgi:hypothetical protein
LLSEAVDRVRLAICRVVQFLDGIKSHDILLSWVVGKTTFLNDTTKSHKCTYIRQYHNLRPYITVSKIPNFDPTRLPFWDTYVNEGTADSIKVGGTMAGEFTGKFRSERFKVALRTSNLFADRIID